MKNLLLVFALVSLFSCKKETIEPIDSEVVELNYKYLKLELNEDQNKELKVKIVYNNLGDFQVSTWADDSHKITLKNKYSIEKTEIIYSYQYAIHDSSLIYFYSLNTNLNNTIIEIRVYD